MSIACLQSFHPNDGNGLGLVSDQTRFGISLGFPATNKRRIGKKNSLKERFEVGIRLAGIDGCMHGCWRMKLKNSDESSVSGARSATRRMYACMY